MSAKIKDQNLQDEAHAQQGRAHAPYSKHPVGVVLETLNEETFGGCNIECVDYLGLEAAEVALAKMVAKNNWRNDPDSIRITRAVFAVPHIDRDHYSFIPSPQSLGRLRFFSYYDIPLLFIDNNGREEGFMLERLLPICPNIDEAMQSFKDLGPKPSKDKFDIAQVIPDPEIAKQLKELHQHSIAPSSHYCVSCVIETQKGGKYGGCNIETSMHSAIHAEESAIANMVSTEGKDAKIKTIYVHTSGQKAGWPCGNCRQKLLEFSTPETQVCVIGTDQSVITQPLYELLPHGFHADDLG